MQPSLLYAQKHDLIPHAIDAQSVGKEFCGYVGHVAPFGVFVYFAGDLRGLVPMRNMSTHFVTNASDMVSVGQSVFVTVKRMEGDKFDLSMRTAVPDELEKVYMLEYEEEMMRVMDEGEEAMSEEEEVEEHSEDDVDEVMKKEEEDESEEMEVEEASEDETPSLDWRTISLGSAVKGHIKTIRPYGVIVELDNGLMGFAQGEFHTKGVECKEGKEVTARILDVNTSLQLLDVTLNAEVMAAAEPQKRQRNRRMSDCMEGLTKGQKTEGVIVAKKNEYLVVCLVNHANQLCLCSTTSMNTAKEPFVGGEIGDVVSVKVVSEASVGEEVAQLRKDVKEVTKEDEEALKRFFDLTRIGVLVNDEKNAKLQVEKQEALEVLDAKLVGQVLRVSVRDVHENSVSVLLSNVKSEHHYRASILGCDMSEEDWGRMTKGLELTAKWAMG